MSTTESGTSGGDLAATVAGLDWYHTFDLPGGVVTPGFYDLRRLAPKVPLPADLRGKRCLDVAASDGFWSFELARRGADHVVSVDLADHTKQDWQGPPGETAARAEGSGRAAACFEVVRDALGLTNLERVDRSVYDLDPEALGRFDYVFMGNVLLHLSDPGKALAAVRSVTEPTGEFLSLEAVSLPMTALRPFTPAAQLWKLDEPRWWTPNMAGHRRLVEAGGFERVASGGPLFAPLGPRIPTRPDRVPKRPSDLAFWLFVRRFGVATSWVRSRPRS